MPARLLPAVRRLWFGNSALRYLIVGGLCFAFDVGLLWLGHDVLGVPLAIATPVAFLASFALTYTMQRLVTFASDARVAPSVVRYTLLVGFNTVATTVIVWLSDSLGWTWLVGKVIAVLATTVWNYFIYRYWVFATPHARSADV
ncbi:MAG: GtrA family protein [Beutenbergiaceae bacterium]